MRSSLLLERRLDDDGVGAVPCIETVEDRTRVATTLTATILGAVFIAALRSHGQVDAPRRI